MEAPLEQVGDRRFVPEREGKRQHEVRGRSEPEAALLRDFRDPGEHRGLAGPRDCKPALAEQLGACDGQKRQPDRPEQGREVPHAPEEGGPETQVGGGDDQERQAFAAPAADLAVEELCGRGGRERRAASVTLAVSGSSRALEMSWTRVATAM